VLIVGPAVESVKEYLELYEERSPDLPACPRCGGPLRKHGRYHRKVIMAEGIVEIPLYRGYCPRCRRTGAAMPAFLKPYARYPADLREKVLEAHIADGRTWREAGDLVFATAMAPVRKTLVRWARDAETIAVSATTLLAEYVTRLEPTPPWTKGVSGRPGPGNVGRTSSFSFAMVATCATCLSACYRGRDLSSVYLPFSGSSEGIP